ncbi:GlxA family transcriptional regulator [Actinomadura napierensis]|uniref:Helix-turn-helix domain-containing protein n=1 Tax=Actinomadura napierensis TaxID=267854 RepID=A0ABP5LJR1_9ACTN
MPQIVFLLVPGVHLLDLAGPAQVFSATGDLLVDAHQGGHGDGPHGTTPPRYRLAYVAEQDAVTSAQGLTVQAATAWPALGPGDIVVVPGWRWRTGDPHAAAVAAATARRLAARHARGGLVASVCAGAFALGDAGLLAGRPCTTHHEIQDDLARRHPRATVVPDVLYVTDDRVVTSAGIASGIDLALHLVAARHGPGTAARVARSMVVYARRNGDEPQASAMLRHRAHLSDTVHRAQDLIDARYTAPLPLAGLAAATGVSERTLTRRFAAATGLSPLRYQQELRLEHAEHLIGQGATTDAAARAVGFTDARMLRRLRAQPRPAAADTRAPAR